MNVIAINGSPRKEWNTAILLNKALEGAQSVGAETELVHLYDLDYKGCTSCFACKIKGGKSEGRCAMKDDLTPLLERLESADAVIMGSPIYFGSTTGELRSFQERFAFPYLQYTNPPSSVFSGKINIGFIYTMNVSEETMLKFGYNRFFELSEGWATRGFKGCTQSLWVCDTLQFADYSKVVSGYFDPEKKKARREEVFPADCERAFEFGVSLVQI